MHTEASPYTYILSSDPNSQNTDNYSQMSSTGRFTQVPNGKYILKITDVNGESQTFNISVEVKYDLVAQNDIALAKVPCKGTAGSQDVFIDVSLNDQIVATRVDLGNNRGVYLGVQKEYVGLKIIKESNFGTTTPINGGIKYRLNEDATLSSDYFEYEITYKNKKDTAGVTIHFSKEMPQIEEVHVDGNKAYFSASKGTPSYTFVVKDTSDNETEVSDHITDLAYGNYTVYVVDQNQCQSAEKGFFISKVVYPAMFFTPDGDGINDTWKILNIEEFDRFSIKIITREGKLIKEYKNSYTPWDGTAFGKNMPSGDYWYMMSYPETDQFYTGHFTLLRNSR